ncbi:MAG: patatin-like phospholipase family protein [Saprospiraceae bacterium]
MKQKEESFIDKIVNFIQTFVVALAQVWYLVLIVILFSLAVLWTDQGTDLLVALKSEKSGWTYTIITGALLMLLALILRNVMRKMQGVSQNSKISSWLSKITKRKYHVTLPVTDLKTVELIKSDNSLERFFQLYLPRLGPSILFIVVFLATINLYFQNTSNYPIDNNRLHSFIYSYSFLLFILVLIIYWLWAYFLEVASPKSIILATSILIIIFLCIPVIAKVTGNSLLWKSYFSFALGLIFLWVTVLRTKRITSWFKNIPLYLNDITLCFTFLVGIYIVILVFQNSVSHHFPIYVILSIFIIYAAILGWVNVHIIKSSNQKNGFIFFIFIIIVILPILLQSSNTRHNLCLINPTSHETPIVRDSLHTYFINWINNKNKDPNITPDNPFEIYMIAGQGGGSRAAYWSGLVLSQLDSQSKGQFQNHIFALSSASGSSAGFGAYVQMKYNNVPYHKSKKVIQEMFSSNFLSSAFRYLFINDFLQSYIAFSNKGRNYRLEQEWCDAFSKAIEKPDRFPKNNMAKSFLKVFYNSSNNESFNVPIFIPNTTEVQKGRRAFFSPVIIDTAPNSMDVLKELRNDKHRLRFSSAMVMSASFPILTASYNINGIGQFADGGYFDNNGINTLNTIITTCQTVLDTLGNGKNKEKFIIKVLHIKNSSENKNENKLKFEKPKNIGQLFIPIKTIINLQKGINKTFEESIEISPNNLIKIILDHEIIIKKGDEQYVPILPLSRYLSEEALLGIEKNLVWDSIGFKTKTKIETIVESL